MTETNTTVLWNKGLELLREVQAQQRSEYDAEATLALNRRLRAFNLYLATLSEKEGVKLLTSGE